MQAVSMQVQSNHEQNMHLKYEKKDLTLCCLTTNGKMQATYPQTLSHRRVGHALEIQEPDSIGITFASLSICVNNEKNVRRELNSIQV